MTLTVTPWDGEPISAPGIYSGVPISLYHSADLCTGPSISSSGLRTIFDPRRGPMAYWVESPLNPSRLEPPEKEAFILGRAAHHLVLGEARFSAHFAIEPAEYPDGKTGVLKPWHNGATFCKEWRAHVTEGEGRTILSVKQVEAIKGMAGVLPWQHGLEDSGLANCAVVRAGALSGLVEHTIIAIDPETGVFLKSRPDAIPLHSTDFGDFKSTQAVDDRSLMRTLDDYRYDMQADLASTCLEQAADLRFTSYAFIFAMAKPPHAVEVVELAQIDLDAAHEDNQIAIRTFARCLDTGRWPGPSGHRGDARYLQRSTRSRDDADTRRQSLKNALEMT